MSGLLNIEDDVTEEDVAEVFKSGSKETPPIPLSNFLLEVLSSICVPKTGLISSASTSSYIAVILLRPVLTKNAIQ